MTKQFSAGDICTFNMFECIVLETKEEKVMIAFAVFSGDEKFFDENDTKWVPPNRLKLVNRPWGTAAKLTEALRTPEKTQKLLSDGITPTFSARKELGIKPEDFSEAEDVVVDLTVDSQVAKIEMKRTHVRKSSLRQKRPVPRTPQLPLSSSSDSSSSDSSSSESPRDSYVDGTGSISGRSVAKNRQARTKPKRSPRKKAIRVSIGETPVPIVPDSYEEDSGRFPSGSATDSSDEFSQEGDAMRRLASEYNQRASDDARRRSLPDEVVFAWDERKRKVDTSSISRRGGSFISAGDSQSVGPSQPATKLSLEETVASMRMRDDANPVDAIRHLWEVVDHLFEPIETIENTLYVVSECLENIMSRATPNVAAETRMMFTTTYSGFTSLTGWVVGILSVMRVTAKFRLQLFSDFMSKIIDKISQKSELKLCYWIAFLVAAPASCEADPVVSSSGFREAVFMYSVGGQEYQSLVDAVTRLIVKCDKNSTLLTPSPAVRACLPSFVVATELLLPMASIIGSFSPFPGEVTPSLNTRLASEFTISIVNYITANIPSISYIPILVKSGGFLPRTDAGESRFDFGKHRGALFKHVIRDKGFCDWSERVIDPSSIGFVEWIDYVSQDRAVAILGTRTLKGDVDLIRLGKENIEVNQIALWICNRGLVAWCALQLFGGLTRRAMVSSRDFSAYAFCVYWLFHTLLLEMGEAGLPSIPPEVSTASLPRPRAEIVKEVFRPILRLGQLYPELSQAVNTAVVAARAKSHNCSADEARNELKAFHSILV